MRPGVKEALVELARATKAGDQTVAKEQAQILTDAIKANNKDGVSLTIKGYAQNQGLSDFIFKDLERKNEVY